MNDKKLVLNIQNKTLLELIRDTLDQASMEYCEGAEEMREALPLLTDQDQEGTYRHDYCMLRVQNKSKSYKFPLRLGTLADDIFYLALQSQLREKSQPIKMGKFILNPKDNSLSMGDTEAGIKLTDKERDILIFLYENDDNLTTKEDLLIKVWNYADSAETHTLETHIYRLRQKIESNPAQPEFLMTDDEGYYLNLEE